MRTVAGVALAGALGLQSATGFAQTGCLRLDQETSGSYRLEGRFSAGAPTASYCLVARAGQRLTIEIKPSADLDTQGYLQFAGTPPQPNWAPGGPGGIVFNEPVPWTGEYRLVVGQRFTEKKTGGFTVDIALDRATPQAKRAAPR